MEGDDSNRVQVIAHDIFPPAIPEGLQAVYSGEGQKPFIDLIWAPVASADLAGYNIYRSEDGSAPIKLNPQLVKTPSYRDTAVTPGKTLYLLRLGRRFPQQREREVGRNRRVRTLGRRGEPNAPRGALIDLFVCIQMYG